jgi:hypothetical protein
VATAGLGLEPAPAFFANLGDFAGPGTPDRHAHYLELVEPLQIPNICVVGNHDLDDEGGPDAWEQVHGPMNFDFRCGHTHFGAIKGAPGEVGEVVIPDDPEGPREDALEFLDAPHPEWGFERREAEFLALLRRHGVTLVCCAHGLGFDHHVHD